MKTNNNDNNINENQSEVVFGKNAVIELLKSEVEIDSVYISVDQSEKEKGFYTSLAKQKNAVVKVIHPIKLERLCQSKRHQGVAVLACLANYCDVGDILDFAAENKQDPLIVIADGIEDPQNLGAIIRTAECAGAHGIILPKRGGCTITSSVLRASAGACGYMKIARVSNLASTIRELKKTGVFCYCADTDGQSLTSSNLTGAVAVVVGSEGFGVSKLVKELCDQTVTIPLLGKITSLNASVAAGVVIYEVVRQRALKG